MAAPRCVTRRLPLLAAKGVNVVYEPARGVRIWSVRDVNLTLREGEFVGLVGESGCGKSTLGFALTRMLRPPARLQAGEILFDGMDISLLDGEDAAPTAPQRLRARAAERHERAQPGAHRRPSLRRHPQGARRSRARHWSRAEIRHRGGELLDKVQLDSSLLDRYPHELSGGMRQRVSIALALALQPRLIVFDEPTTALDVIVQKAVMETIKDLQREDGFTAILISHDLGVVLEATDRVMVMYAGRDRRGPAVAALARRRAPSVHRGAARAATPTRAPTRSTSAAFPASHRTCRCRSPGCPFTPRCPLAEDICRQQDPPLTPLGSGSAACHVRAREAVAPAGGQIPATVRQPTAQTSADAATTQLRRHGGARCPTDAERRRPLDAAS